MTRTNPTFAQLDRAIGAVVASAAGDALGAGYEFAPPVSPADITMRPGTLTGCPAGWWTDDTAMAIAILQVAAQRGELCSDNAVHAVGQRFLDWYDSDPPDVGMWTSRVLDGVTSGQELTDRAAEAQIQSPNSAGNGSLMRTGPVALAHLGDTAAVATAARRLSALTHPHPDAVEACVLWSVAIEQSILHGHLVSPAAGLDFIDVERRSFWRQRLDEAESHDPSTFSPNGWAVAALQAAWSAIHATTDSPRHLDAALRRAISIGDDTDTVAAIAGALLGAAYGVTAVPFAWRRHLAGWPRGVTDVDLFTLAALAARGGEPDGSGWPLVDSMQAAYASFAPEGTVVTFDEDPGVIFGDVGALPTVDAEAFLSLCRVGRKDLRGDEHHLVWFLDGPGNIDAPRTVADAADAIAQLRADHQRVFVHCVRAETRTPSVALAWLVRQQGLSRTDALSRVRGAFPHINTENVEELTSFSIPDRWHPFV